MEGINMLNEWIKMCTDFLVSLYYHSEVNRKFSKDEKKVIRKTITILRSKML